MSDERPAILYWMRVINPDSQDYERVGMLVNVITKTDDPNLTEPHYIIDFQDGHEPTAFTKPEVERYFAS